MVRFNKYVSKSCIVRYKFISNNNGPYDMNGDYVSIPKSSYASLVLIPDKNILGMRDSYKNVGKVSKADIKHIYINNRAHFRDEIKAR